MAAFDAKKWTFNTMSDDTKPVFPMPEPGMQYIQINKMELNENDWLNISCHRMQSPECNYRLSYKMIKAGEGGKIEPNERAGGTVKTLMRAVLGPNWREIAGEEYTLEEFIDYINSMCEEAERPFVVVGDIKISDYKEKKYINCYEFSTPVNDDGEVMAEFIEEYGNPNQYMGGE